MTDYISRADAIEAVQKMVPYVIDNDTGKWGILVNKANVITELSALPSADAESKVDSIVIRPTTYLSKSDFDKWAAEVKKESNRIIVIPHNSEVVVNTVKGLWVEERGDWYGGGAWVCSICGYGYSFGAYHEANEFRYCPNCGARMTPYKGGDDK